MGWIPVRYVQSPQVCGFCRNTIPKGSPGRTTGTRGTKAWFNNDTGEWECCPCREEATRAELARERGA